MAYAKKTISVAGTEMEFLQEVIDFITSVDERIICKTNLADYFGEDGISALDTSVTPEIVFDVGELLHFSLSRPNALNNATANYLFKWYGDGIKQLSSQNIALATSAHRYDVNIQRTFNIAVIASDNVIEIVLGGHNITVPTNGTHVAFLISDNVMAFTYLPLINYPLSSTNQIIYNTKNAENNIFRTSKCFNFACSDDKIKMIQSSPLLNSVGECFGEFYGLINCSTVPVNTKITIDTGTYFAVDANTLIKIG